MFNKPYEVHVLEECGWFWHLNWKFKDYKKAKSHFIYMTNMRFTRNWRLYDREENVVLIEYKGVNKIEQLQHSRKEEDPQ